MVIEVYSNFEDKNYNYNYFLDEENTNLLAILELSNWKELSELYALNSRNQFDFLLDFLDEFHIDKIDELKGAYAFVYFKNNKIYFFRDKVGIIPLCYEFKTIGSKISLNFSIKKSFISETAKELNPKEYLYFDIDFNKIDVFKRNDFFKLKKSFISNSFLDVKGRVKFLFENSIKKQIICGCKKKKKTIALLFSGGTDSTLIALNLRKLGIDFVCYTVNIKYGNIVIGEDLYYAKKFCDKYGIKLRIVEIDNEDLINNYTKETMKIIESKDYTKVSVALVFYLAFKKIKEDNIFKVFSGIGSEEIFADYKRELEVENINEICLEGLGTLWKRDLYRDFSLAKNFNLKLRFPFLDNDFIDYGISINPEFKINKETKINKIILREILKDYDIDLEFINRKKKAAQYGSRTDRVFEKLANKKKLKKQEYLNLL